jgi:hypothetical protein
VVSGAGVGVVVDVESAGVGVEVAHSAEQSSARAAPTPANAATRTTTQATAARLRPARRSCDPSSGGLTVVTLRLIRPRRARQCGRDRPFTSLALREAPDNEV